MYNLLYTIVASILLLSCAAQRNSNQNNVKVFAYRQPVLQGVNPITITDDKGNTESVVKERSNYFIYIESPSPDIKVQEVWVRKVQYAASTENVSNTPVLMLTSIMPNAKPDTLVQRTANKVLQVTLESGAAPGKLSSWLQKRINEHELVMRCVVDGKEHYYAVKAIKNLPPVALQ
ncbi:MAG TPA: hypothetical protein VD993_19915 [Chitinophagaceae bacterium]|nr:hypothetical protein [Chitinophagaceae bacterium]